MVLPNFLIVGVQKAGTTSVYTYLKQHPQVFMSPLKETNFMNREPGATSAPVLTRGGRQKIVTIEDYQALFEGATDEVAIGEASPNYLFNHELAIANIKRYTPDAKLIAILRNPVERAYSDYLMHIRQVIGDQKSLAEQLKSSPQTSHTLLKGQYYQGVKHFLDAFGPDQVKLFLYEELRQNSATLMEEIYRFIGVDPTFTADTAQRQQQAEVPKNKTINQLLRTHNPVRAAAGSVLKVLLPEQKRQALRSHLIAANSQGKDAMPLSPIDRQQLKSYYKEDILRLQDLLNRDLAAWL